MSTAPPQPSPLPRFDPPGRLTDLKEKNLPGWSRIISDMCDSGIIGNTSVTNDAPRPQFFNATKKTFTDPGTLAPIVWRAFPRKLQVNVTDEKRWKASDSSRNVQDEYCEWSVARDANGKITQMTFTCEGPEYWKYLASTQPDTLLQLYQQHVSAAVQKRDLFQGSQYQPKNKWNNSTVNGAMHLIQPNNTLGAEVELAAAATIVRPDRQGGYIEDQTDLIKCSRYGDEGRFSDPSIGAAVNALAREGAMISLANPVGIYFDSFEPVGFITPDNTNANEFWKWTRGETGLWLRGVFEVPAAKGYAVGDIEIQGKGKIRYGGMVADYVNMKLTGIAYDINPANIKPAAGCIPRSRDFLPTEPSDGAHVTRWTTGADTIHGDSAAPAEDTQV